MTREMEDRIDRLLHDAEHAHSGAMFARRLHDAENAKALFKKSQHLRREALALDPDKVAPAWAETEPL